MKNLNSKEHKELEDRITESLKKSAILRVKYLKKSKEEIEKEQK